MSNLFKSSKKEQQETQIDPRIYNEVLQNLQLARQISQIPFEPYRGLMVAPFTRDYMTGEAMTRAIAGEGGFVPEVEGAARQAAQLMGFQPQQVAAERVGTQFTPERVAAERAATPFGVGQIGAGQIGTQFAPERVAAQQLGTTFGARDIGGALAGGPERVGAQQISEQFTPQQIVSQAVGQALRGGPERISAGQVGAQFAAPAIGAERVGTQFAARDIAGLGATPTVQAASLLGPQGGGSIADYMNPYQQSVIDVGLSDIQRAEDLARRERAQRATAARAFGGSRAAVEEGIAAGEAARERNRFLAEQRAQGFQQAAALREADVARQQQAALANQQAAMQVMQLSQAGQISNQERDLRLQQLGLTAEQANQAAAMEAARANQQAQQQAQQLGLTAEQFNVQQGMAAQQANQQAVQDYMRMGLTAEQANQQAALDAARANQAAGLQAGQMGLTAQQANQEAALRAGLANQQAVQQYMQMGLSAEQANQQAQLDAQRMGLTAGQANQQAAMQAALANQQMGMQGQQMGMQAQQFNVQQQMEAQRQNMENQLRAQGMSAEQARFNSQQAMQASLANQQAGMQAQQFGLQAQGMNQEAALRAQLANQQAGLSGAQFQLGAGRQFADLGQQALQNRYGAAAAMTGLGSAQQQLMQQYLNAQQQEFMRRINYPMQQLAVSQGAVAASPYNQTQYGTTQGRPGLWDVVGNVFSDERMKYNIKPIRNPLDKINRIEGVTYQWKDDDDMDAGVIAQDVERAMPEAVSMDDETGMRKVSVPQMVGVLTEAVKELDAKVEGKKKRGKRNV